MDCVYLEHGFLYYYGNRAGYQKGEVVYVDSIFFTRHLRLMVKEKYGLYTKEQQGLYKRLLLARTYGDDGKAYVQFCRIWQWREAIDAEKKYLSYQNYMREYGMLDLSDYQIVYDGYMESGELEEIFQKFATNLPEGFPGHAISMSDIIELYGPLSGSSFFYVDEFGFVEIEVQEDDKKKAGKQTDCNLGRTGCGQEPYSGEACMAVSADETADCAGVL